MTAEHGVWVAQGERACKIRAIKVSRGRVTKYVKDYGQPALAAQIDITGGNSGGPIINDRGCYLPERSMSSTR